MIQKISSPDLTGTMLLEQAEGSVCSILL